MAIVKIRTIPLRLYAQEFISKSVRDVASASIAKGDVGSALALLRLHTRDAGITIDIVEDQWCRLRGCYKSERNSVQTRKKFKQPTRWAGKVHVEDLPATLMKHYPNVTPHALSDIIHHTANGNFTAVEYILSHFSVSWTRIMRKPGYYFISGPVEQKTVNKLAYKSIW